MKLIDILCNFTVTDEYVGELVDTRKIDNTLMEMLVPVIKEVAGDVFPLYENFTGAEAKEILDNKKDSDTMREIVKFACAVMADEELELNEFGIFEPTAHFETCINYYICFPDADGYTFDWPVDYDGNAEPKCKVKDGVGIVPKRIRAIEESAFANNTDLVSVTIPDYITEIGEDAFYACSNLTNVTIPGSVTSIGEAAFYGCASLESIKIPNGVTTIGDYIFHSCTSLKSITLPDSVRSIGEDMCYRCENLKSIKVPAGKSNYFKELFNDEDLARLVVEI